MKTWFVFWVAVVYFFTGAAWADVSVAIAKVKPSVVIVGTFKPTNSPRFALRGTGFVVGQDQASTGNLVITNAHVLEQPAELDPKAALVVQIRVTQAATVADRAGRCLRARTKAHATGLPPPAKTPAGIWTGSSPGWRRRVLRN